MVTVFRQIYRLTWHKKRCVTCYCFEVFLLEFTNIQHLQSWVNTSVLYSRCNINVVCCLLLQRQEICCWEWSRRLIRTYDDKHCDNVDGWFQRQAQPLRGCRSAGADVDGERPTAADSAAAAHQSSRPRHGPASHPPSRSGSTAATLRARWGLNGRYVGTWSGVTERAKWRDLAASSGWRWSGSSCSSGTSRSASWSASTSSLSVTVDACRLDVSPSLPTVSARGRDQPARIAAASAAVQPWSTVRLRRPELGEQPRRQRICGRSVECSRRRLDVVVVSASTSVRSSDGRHHIEAVGRAAQVVGKGRRVVDLAACSRDAQQRGDLHSVRWLPLRLLSEHHPSVQLSCGGRPVPSWSTWSLCGAVCSRCVCAVSVSMLAVDRVILSPLLY